MSVQGCSSRAARNAPAEWSAREKERERAFELTCFFRSYVFSEITQRCKCGACAATINNKEGKRATQHKKDNGKSLRCVKETRALYKTYAEEDIIYRRLLRFFLFRYAKVNAAAAYVFMCVPVCVCETTTTWRENLCVAYTIIYADDDVPFVIIIICICVCYVYGPWFCDGINWFLYIVYVEKI